MSGGLEVPSAINPLTREWILQHKGCSSFIPYNTRNRPRKPVTSWETSIQAEMPCTGWVRLDTTGIWVKRTEPPETHLYEQRVIQHVAAGSAGFTDVALVTPTSRGGLRGGEGR